MNLYAQHAFMTTLRAFQYPMSQYGYDLDTKDKSQVDFGDSFVLPK